MAFLILLFAGLNSLFAAHLQDKHESTFSYVYDHCIWGRDAEGNGTSGGGSSPESIAPYMEFLQHFLFFHQIKTVVDAGCGNWEFSRYIDWTGIEYFGFDVVQSVIDKNIEKYANSHIHFEKRNIIRSPLPKADLLICKHVLQHLSNQDILDFLPKLKNYKFCLITNEVYPSTLSSDNPDIRMGGGRKVDLSKPPFNVEGVKVLNFPVADSVHQVFLIINPDAS